MTKNLKTRHSAKTIRLHEYELPLRIEKEKHGGYSAYSPKWRDCYAQGDTVEEAIAEATMVAASLVELFHEEGMDIPLKRHQRGGGMPPHTVQVPLYVSL